MDISKKILCSNFDMPSMIFMDISGFLLFLQNFAGALPTQKCQIIKSMFNQEIYNFKTENKRYTSPILY